MTGFTTDIGASADDLNLSVSLFFITFVIFQPISAAFGRRVGAKHWIPFIMVSSPLKEPFKCRGTHNYKAVMGHYNHLACIHTRAR
jgi:hypothetical protein